MDSDKKYQSKVQEGDYCNVSDRLKDEARLIEDHPQHLIEDKYKDTGAAVPPPVAEAKAVAEPPKKKSGAWAWWFAAAAAVVLIGSWLIYSHRSEGDVGNRVNSSGLAFVAADSVGSSIGNTVAAVKQGAAAATDSVGSAVSGLYAKASGAASSAVKSVGNAVKSAAGSVAATVQDSTSGISGNQDTASPGEAELVENYVYYFANNDADVDSNAVLDQAAEIIEETDADVTITAYASNVGNKAYNENLSEQRAENIAEYLVAHGVPRDNVTIVNGGQSEYFGDAPHNRRANIHVDYHG